LILYQVSGRFAAAGTTRRESAHEQGNFGRNPALAFIAVGNSIRPSFAAGDGDGRAGG
jgi:hypothetical protein